jgi:hypothetical protein
MVRRRSKVTNREIARDARCEALSDATRRRAFAVILLEDTALTIDELSDFIVTDDGALREEDIPWVLDRRTVAPVTRRPYWTRAALLLARDSRDANIWDRIITESATDTELAAEFAHFLTPVMLDDPQVREKQARRARVRERAAARAARGIHAAKLLERALAVDETGRVRAWPHVLQALRIAPDGSTGHERFETPTTHFPGWRAATPSIRVRIVRSAERYLETAAPGDATWIGTQTIPGREVCGYGALRLILDENEGWLTQQGGNFWRNWAAAILGYPAWREQGHHRLIHFLYAAAPDRVYELLPRIAGERAALDALDSIWDGSLSTALLAALTDEAIPSSPKFRLMTERLLAHDAGTAEQRLVEDALVALDGSSQPVYLPDLLLLLLTRRPHLWTALWPRVAADRNLAEALIRRWAAADRHEHYTANVHEAALGELYIFLTTELLTRPEMGANEQIDFVAVLKPFRDGLLQAIGRRATDAAFATLRQIATQFPAQAGMVPGIERSARHQRRAAQSQPLTIEEARAVILAR